MYQIQYRKRDNPNANWEVLTLTVPKVFGKFGVEYVSMFETFHQAESEFDIACFVAGFQVRLVRVELMKGRL